MQDHKDVHTCLNAHINTEKYVNQTNMINIYSFHFIISYLWVCLRGYINNNITSALQFVSIISNT